jgi:hypothetical protein
MTTSPAVQEQIVRATAAHGMWKARLLEAIEHSSSEFTDATVRADDLCDFGKWLHHDCDANTRANPHFATVKHTHAAFHQLAARVLSLAVAGKKTEAQNLLKGDYTRVSFELVTALQVWRRS